jgi:DNA polymerase III sliding clamp (beta) subunit (PCNA family)
MHLQIPIVDLVQLVSILKPIKSLTTQNLDFAIYTLEASEGRLRLIAGDGIGLVSYGEITAEVLRPGRLSVNGVDFFTAALSFGDSTEVLVLRETATKLMMELVTSQEGQKVKHKRTLSLLKDDLTVFQESFVETAIYTVPSEVLLGALKLSGKFLSAHTSDMDGLSGILLRTNQEQLQIVVSDGARLLEITHSLGAEVAASDVLISKTVYGMLAALFRYTQTIEVRASSARVKLTGDMDGKFAFLSAPVIIAEFPEYRHFFNNQTGTQFSVDARMFLQALSNVRKLLSDNLYRVNVLITKAGITLTNTKVSHADFTSEGIPLMSFSGDRVSVTINALLLESLVQVCGNTELFIVVPGDNKPLSLSAIDKHGFGIRAALGVIEED